MRKFSTNKLCILALCSVINLIGGQIALLLSPSDLSGFFWNGVCGRCDGAFLWNDSRNRQ